MTHGESFSSVGARPVASLVKQASRPVPMVEGPDLEEINAWLKTGSSKWSPEQLARAILKLQPGVRGDVLERLAIAINSASSPERWEILLETLASIWAEQQPGPATSYLGRLDDQSHARPLQRNLLNDWMNRDFTGVVEYLQQSWRDSPVPTSELDLLVSISQTQQKERFDELLDWVNGLRNEDGLKSAVGEVLARTGESQNFSKIAGLFETNLDDFGMASCASELAAREAAEHPDDVIRWLKKLAPDASPWAPMIIDDFFDAMARSHPAMAVKLINDGFTDRFAGDSPEEMAQASGRLPGKVKQQLFDRALGRVLNNVMSQNPKYALSCVDFFYDPAVKAEYANTIRSLISSTVGQRAGLIPVPDNDQALTHR